MAGAAILAATAVAPSAVSAAAFGPAGTEGPRATGPASHADSADWTTTTPPAAGEITSPDPVTTAPAPTADEVTPTEPGPGLASSGAPADEAAGYPCGPSTCTWTGWMPLDLTIDGDIPAVQLVPGGREGRIDAVAVRSEACFQNPCQHPEEAIGIATQLEPGGADWSAVELLPPGSPAPDFNYHLLQVTAFRDGAGHLHVFKSYNTDPLRSTYGYTLVISQGTNGWGSWTSWGRFVPSAAGINQDGRLELFGVRATKVGTNPHYYGPLMHAWQDVGGGWSPEFPLGTGDFSGPVGVGRNADGRLQVFANRNDNRLYPAGPSLPNVALSSLWQTTPNGTWSPTYDLEGGGITMGSLVNNADGRLELFATGPGGASHMWQHAPNSSWTPMIPFAGNQGTEGSAPPVAARGATGRIEAFTHDTSGQTVGRWQYEPNGGWSGWTPMPGTPPSYAPGVTTDAAGHLVLHRRASTGVTWWNVQQR